jgi:hypothetical protein
MPIGYTIGTYLGRVKTSFYEKLVSHSILQHTFSPLKTVRMFSTREEIWDYAAQHIGTEVTLLEFGVWWGYSMRHFLKSHPAQSSRFYGFDSFEGLPQAWEGKTEGHFSTQGNVPQIDDTRVKLVKGWFQNTVPEFLKGTALSSTILVHFDADLYSSTLYLLQQLSRVPHYYFICDEFPGDETRAFYNTLQANGAFVTFLGRTARSMQVFGFMDNSRIYEQGGPTVSAG